MDFNNEPPPSTSTMPRDAAAAERQPGASAPPVTPTLSDDRFAGWPAVPDPILAICNYDVEGDWELPDLKDISVGASSECSISVPGLGLSARHFLLARHTHRLRLYDLDSTNGTFVRERRLAGWADLSPGDVFVAMPVTFVCLNAEMRTHRPTLFEIVGTGGNRSPDWVMVQAAAGSEPLLLTGEPGTELERLAEAIHAMSLRRSRRPRKAACVRQDCAVQVALIREASKSSLILLIEEGWPQVDPNFASMLFSPSYGVRLIALAPSLDVAQSVLGDARVALMQHISVCPLGSRRGDIRKLLDRRFAEQSFSRRFADLTPANQKALKNYHWPENLPELRKIADAIIAYARHKSLRMASKPFGISHTTLARWFADVGLNQNRLFDRDE